MALKIIAPIVMVVCFLTLIAGFCFCAANEIQLTYQGFAVDSTGKLYIGRSQKIEVYQDQTLVDTITSVGSIAQKSFGFTIKDDAILLSNSVYAYELDLDGQVLHKEKDTYSRLYHETVNNKTFTAPNGDTYRMERPLGWVRIVCGEEVCYQMPAKEYLSCIFLILSGIGFALGTFASSILFFIKSKIVTPYS